MVADTPLWDTRPTRNLRGRVGDLDDAFASLRRFRHQKAGGDQAVIAALHAAQAAIPATSVAIATLFRDAVRHLRAAGVRSDLATIGHSSGLSSLIDIAPVRSRMTALGECWTLPGAGVLLEDGRFFDWVGGERHEVSKASPSTIRKFARQNGRYDGSVQLIDRACRPTPYTPDALLAVPTMAVHEREDRRMMLCFLEDLPLETRFAASDDGRAYLVQYDAGEKGAPDRWMVTDLKRLLDSSFEQLLGPDRSER